MPFRLVDEKPKLPSTGLQQKPTDRSTLGALGATVARPAEAILGLPGDILQAGGGLLTAGLKRLDPNLLGKYVPDFQSPLPTSEKLRGVTKAVTGEALEPKSEVGQFYDDVVSDLALLSLPIKGRVPFKSALTRSLAGNFASWGAKELGAGKLGQAGAKIGVMTLAGLAGGRKALEEQMRNSYQTAEQIAANKFAQAEKLDQEVAKALKYTYTGIQTPAKEFLRKPLIGIEANISGGRIPMPQLLEIKRNINSLMGDPSTPREAKKFLGGLGKEVRSVIEDFGKKHKDFAREFAAGEDIWRGLNTETAVRQWVQDKLPVDKLTSPLLKGLFYGGTGAKYGLPGLAAAFGIQTAGTAADNAIRSLEFIGRSKQAQKYYADALQSAAKQNSKAFFKSVNKLEAIADKFEPEISKKVEEPKSRFRLL